MRTKAIHLSALAAVLVSGTALAQTSPASPSTTTTTTTTSGADYAKLDKDKDGTVSKKEAAANKDLTKQWDTLDMNKDGKLDEAEFAQFQASPTGADSGKDSSKPGDIKY